MLTKMKADQRKSLGLVLIETSNALNGHSYGIIFLIGILIWQHGVLVKYLLQTANPRTPVIFM